MVAETFYLQSALLAAEPWLRHGFALRDAPALGAEEAAIVKQIHSPLIVRAEQQGLCGEADALVTDRMAVRLAIRTADCVPLLLADPEHRAVAAVHAGWKGTLAAIAQHTVARMQNEFGSKPRALLVAIGPCIQACCFEVGDEVAEHFTGDVIQRQSGRRPHIDLAAANHSQLLSAGISANHIDVSQACTCCDAERFHSYRRDGLASGRLSSFIELA